VVELLNVIMILALVVYIRF